MLESIQIEHQRQGSNLYQDTERRYSGGNPTQIQTQSHFHCVQSQALSRPPPPLITASSLSCSSKSESEIVMPSSHAQEGQPPVTYMANLIAQQLLQVGAAMFGRRSDADCILRVGNEQYYVHVQLLASRSSTFRRIFDEMIAKEAWGVSHDVDLSSEDRASFGHLDEEDEEVFNYGSDCGYQDPANISYGEGCGLISDDDENLRDDKSVISSTYKQKNQCRRFFPRSISQESSSQGPMTTSNPLGFTSLTNIEGPSTPSPLTCSSIEDKSDAPFLEQLSFQAHRYLRLDDESTNYCQANRACKSRKVYKEGYAHINRDSEDHGDEIQGDASEIVTSDDDEVRSAYSEDTDSGLPELSIALIDPERSHFSELLYWLYTGDNNRWIRFFTPDNYSSILQNILLLNIGTNAVFEICEAFEDTTAPELGLRGMANNVLCVSSQPVSIDTVKNPYRDSAMATLQ